MSSTRTLHLGRSRTVIHESGDPGASPVVLLHGWGATTGLNFPGVFEALGAEHRVIGIDHRGHGRGFPAGRTLSIDDLATDVVDILGALGIARARLVGYSMGGAVALSATRRAPGLVDGLVMCATAARFAVGDAARSAPWWLEQQRRLPSAVRRAMTGAVLPNVAPRAGLTVEQARQLRGHDGLALWDVWRDLNRFDARPWAGQLGMPASSIIPTGDVTVPVHRQIELARLLGARITNIEGNHRVAAEHPDRFIPALHTALRGL